MARNMNVPVSGKLSFMTARLICIATLMSFPVSAALAQGKAEAGATDAKAAETILSGATYDVATFKPSVDSAVGLQNSFDTMPNGGFIAKGLSLKHLVCGAYDKLDFQCLGGPKWFDSDEFDVEAKPGDAVSEQLVKLSWQERSKVAERMMQALFADRIQLKIHHETRELPTFALVIAKGGLKKGGLKMTDVKTEDWYSTDNGKIQTIESKGISMKSLVVQLSQQMGHIVVDQTGLRGLYAFTLKFSSNLDATADSSEPSIYIALQEQLGLKLVPTKAPVDVLVIDHVEKPSAN
jgi:uncharacterized protein (TIGR03435 family)